MNDFEIDFEDEFEDVNFADQLLRSVEKDYGRSIARIPKFRKSGSYTFDITIIFTDFRLLEAEIRVKSVYGLPSVTLEGKFY